MSLWSGFYTNYKQIKLCKLNVNFWTNYFLREFDLIFSFIPYSHYHILSICVTFKFVLIFKSCFNWFSFQLMNIILTLCWSYIDLIIMVVCMGIATRFQQIGQRVEVAIKQVQIINIWCNNLMKNYVLAFRTYQRPFGSKSEQITSASSIY